MGATAIFDFEAFSLRYPEFNQISEDLAQAYFDEATLYHVNDGSGPVVKESSQRMLLNMLTAHIAQLNVPQPGAENQLGGPQLVGPITSASQGSVSVSTNPNIQPGSEAWFAQTKYGFAYWQATVAYRTMLYRANPGRNMNPFYPFYPRR